MSQGIVSRVEEFLTPRLPVWQPLYQDPFSKLKIPGIIKFVKPTIHYNRCIV